MYRIVVAEDETLIRMDLVEMLTESGYQVVAQATNGQEAITLATEHKPDLIILDYFFFEKRFGLSEG